ncbi:MAG: aspartate--tRNA(Asn) ligase [Chloroflexia bacterium]|nr:aspartate--tRNA(Asn) ligase [Chloroflexia bacterium]
MSAVGELRWHHETPPSSAKRSGVSGPSVEVTTVSPASLSPTPVSSASPSAASRVWTSDLARHAGEQITVSGWLHHRRSLKAVCFLIVRDASGLAQVVVDDLETRAVVESLPHESVVTITGRAVASAQAPGGIEIHRPAVTVVSAALDDPPVELFRPELGVQLPTMLDAAAVSLRHPRRAAVQRLSAAAVEGFRSALRAEHFVEIATPKIIGTTPEGGANVFELDYFGKPAYLAQSPQLYKQMMIGALERVFETAPAFRAEPHATSRHLSQFVSLDAEMAFVEDHRTVMSMTTVAVSGMVAAARAVELERTYPDLAIPDVPDVIPDIHFADALDLISEATGEDVRGEPDLAPAHERWLGDWARREFGSDWLYVTGYPMAKRPFYTHPDRARPQWSNSFDLLFRGLEIVTGGQRLHRYDDYLTALAARGIDSAGFDGYLLAFRHGMPPHGGFALGLERFVAQVAGIANVRETTLFPRDMQRLTP